MPPPNHGGSTEEEIRYRDLVEAHMIHNCNWSNVNGCKASSTCKCKRGYDDTVIQERTSFDERGFPEYKRDHECDLKVVPHIRLILLDWEGHANVEYAGSAFCVLYLYKYLYKGSKKVKVSLSENENHPDENREDIRLYLRGRFLCAMDAMWRILGYHTYPAPDPRVQVIKVKMPNVVCQLLLETKSCDLLVYFNRPTALQNMKYTELFKYYISYSKLPARFRHNPESENDINGYFTLHIQTLPIIYLCKRADTTAIIRLEMLYITAGTQYITHKLILRNSY